MEHEFTKTIREILRDKLGDRAEKAFDESEMLKYINIKTKSANKGSKSRGSFANLYAVYVLVEDYIAKDFHRSGKYSEYEGAVVSRLLKRQRQLPFGKKLQNHALNHRMNEEFKKYFPTCDYIPILRSPETNRYWINENLLKIKIENANLNLVEAIIEIIDRYTETKKRAFEKFIEFRESSGRLSDQELIQLIKNLVEPTADARIFEIVSYSILRYYYHGQNIYWGFDPHEIQEENLKLFKTGRTNANDGGIDFVMKPLGRFFQVTETVDVNKYFLDIDKIEKYPITFVVKSSDLVSVIERKIREQAEKQYPIKTIVSRYMQCIEEIINIPILLERFKEAVTQGHLGNILAEIVKQSKVEFSYEDDYDITEYADTVGEEA
jgi:hypothetical protein